MLLMTLLLMVLATVFVAAVRRDRASLLIFGLCLSLTLMFSGIIIYTAKIGGLDYGQQVFLFLSPKIRVWLEYLVFPLDQLGYLISLGRHLFPIFFLLTAMDHSMLPFVRRFRRSLRLLLLLPPVVSLVLYYPSVFYILVRGRFWLQRLVMQGTVLWILLYLAASLAILFDEYRSITIGFCKRQYRFILVFLLCMALLYGLYFLQDPIQVYQLYGTQYLWVGGRSYSNPSMTLGGWVVLTVSTLACMAVGFYTLLTYTQLTTRDDSQDIAIQRKFDAASEGASVFVHSIKNQLLANRVVHKRLRALETQEHPDMEAVWQYLHTLSETNEMMLERVDELYRTVKTKSIYLVPVPVREVTQIALGRFAKKYPQGRVEEQYLAPPETLILADSTHLGEALYNLLVNGWEATLSAGREFPVRLILHRERLYTVLEVADRGAGVPPGESNRIFEPFYSSKNSNNNWGMGLYYVRAIVKSHLGSVRMESEPGEGTHFFLMLPRYDSEKEGRKP